MATPINDFVKSYRVSETVRFYMPGHKGKTFHGMEKYDITEIKGADYLFESEGIIGESERQTSKAFGTGGTYYSTEGSSLCIKAMLGIVNICRKNHGRKMICAAPRNVHKAFINACILLDIEVIWVYPKGESRSICSSNITPEDILSAVEEYGEAPDCVYVTSPDYLGNISDIKGISQICKKMGVPFLCDNAHGAYLNFLSENLHPIHLGADMCCDSAHKTLPCYTGGAYLHISQNAPREFILQGKNVMSLFASTSPSYLIMESLDLCGDYLSGEYPSALFKTVERTSLCKKRLREQGWVLVGEEPCKITVCAVKSGYEGNSLGDMLRKFSIEPEYTDCQYVVFMVTPFNGEEDFLALENAMGKIPQQEALSEIEYPTIPKAVKRLSIRQSAFSTGKKVAVEKAEGKICAMTVTCCQPSVPVVVSGEEITPDVIKILKRYSINEIYVLC